MALLIVNTIEAYEASLRIVEFKSLMLQIALAFGGLGIIIIGGLTLMSVVGLTHG